MIRARSAWWKILARIRHRSAILFEPGSVLLRPGLIKIEGSGRVILGKGAIVEPGARLIVRDAMLIIGSGAYVGTNATIVAYADTRIGDATLLGERVSIHSEDHGPRSNRQLFCVSPITIGKGCWICAGAIVTKGVTIGDGTTIGANAVVTSDIGPGVLAAGMPARVIRAIL